MVDLRPTPYRDVNQILSMLLTNVKTVLQAEFVGMYLYGSLSSGDFDPRASDIDFLVVTTDLLSPDTIAELKSMHERLWNTGLKWAGKLEGSYIPESHLRRYEKTNIPYPTVNEGRFYTAPHGSDWIIQRQVIRAGSIALAGPDPKTRIDPVGPDDIRRAVKGILEEWWFPMLDDPSGLRDHDRPYLAFAILTMCRSLYALEYGNIISKTAAAKWAQERLGGKWSRVIEEALAVRLGQGNADLYENALDLIAHAKESIHSKEKKR